MNKWKIGVRLEKYTIQYQANGIHSFEYLFDRVTNRALIMNLPYFASLLVYFSAIIQTKCA